MKEHGIRMRIGLGLQLGQGVPLSSICHRRVSLKHPEKSYTLHRLDTRDTREPSVYSQKSGCRYPLPVRFHDAWAIISQCAVHALANDVFQDLPGRWCLLLCVMSGRFEELLDRLLLEWRAARQAGENVFLAWRARFFLSLSAHLAERLWVSLRCRQGSRRPRDFFSLFALGRKGVADFPPLAYPRNRKWTHSPFLRSLCSTTALFVRRQQDENRVLDLAFARKRTDWQLNGRSIAVLWMIDLFNKTTKKKGTTVFEGGGGGRNLWLPHCRSREHAVRNRSLLAIWLDKDWGNPDRNVVAQIINTKNYWK